VEFVVIGAGVAGLTAAIALGRVGHKVTVLEREKSLDAVRSPLFNAENYSESSPQNPVTFRGTRMPPNMTKIFNHWDMNKGLKEISVVSSKLVLARRTLRSVCLDRS